MPSAVSSLLLCCDFRCLIIMKPTKVILCFFEVLVMSCKIYKKKTMKILFEFCHWYQYGIWLRNLKHRISLAHYGLWVTVTAGEQPSCKRARPSVAFCQHTHAVISDKCWTLLADRDAGCQLCPFSVCSAAQRCAVRLNAAGWGQCGPSSCWHAEMQLSLSEATPLQLNTSRGWRSDKRVDSFLPCSCQCLLIVLDAEISLLSPFHSSLLMRCQGDAAPTLQVVSREVHA